MPHGIVEALQNQMRTEGTLDWTRLYKIEQAVCNADGPFAEFVDTLEYLDAAGRVRVLLDLLGRTVSVTLRCQTLRSAT